MSKLYDEAFRRIPKRFKDSETRSIEWEEMKKVYIANPKYAPMFYHKRKWHYVRFKKEMTSSEVIVHRLTPPPIFNARVDIKEYEALGKSLKHFKPRKRSKLSYRGDHYE